MERRSLLFVLSGLIVVYYAARASSQNFEDPTKFYKNMTFEYDVRHRGEVGIPSCVKQLMACWDVMKSDIICGNGPLFFETACSLMRHKACNEYAPFGDKDYYTGEKFWLFEQFCPDKEIGYWTRRRLQGLQLAESGPPGGRRRAAWGGWGDWGEWGEWGGGTVVLAPAAGDTSTGPPNSML